MDYLEAYQEARENLKPYLVDYVNKITDKSKGANKYVCPLCASGTGKNKSGAFSVYVRKQSFKCFSCGAGGDITDLYKQVNGTDEKTAVKELCAMYGVSYPGAADQGEPAQPRTPARPTPKAEPEQEPEINFTDFINAAAEHIQETDYPQRRGLSEAIIKRFSLGYVQEWRHPKAPKAPASPRLIIPISAFSYLARDTREKLTPEQEGFKKQKVKGKEGATWIFYRKALNHPEQPIFIVEGEIDALSIMEVGGLACGLGSIANIKQFLREAEERRPGKPLIICLDNDEPGQKAQDELAKGLEALHLPFYRRDINGDYKDANERLIADREGLTKRVKEITGEVEELERQKAAKDESLTEQEQKAEQEALKQMQNGKRSNAEYINEFMGHITDFASTPETKTGFHCLDKALDGGLYEGLYSIGAISSLGKTSFVLQICDQMAQAGEHILFFSMEMPRLELMAKSISRETFLLSDKTGDRKNAKDVRHIMNGRLAKAYTKDEQELIAEAITHYASYANNIYMQEGVGDITVERIAQTVREHIKEHNKKPIVVLDYLQIIAPSKDDNGKTDKQITDKNIVSLKRLARDEKLKIIAISSFNRENYTEPVSYSSFKESGAIEYSSDVLIGLQYKGMDYQTQKNGRGEEVTESTTQHIARIRKLTNENNRAGAKGEAQEIEIKILKNRNGYKSTQNIWYYPKYNTFTEITLETETAESFGEASESGQPSKLEKQRGHKW